MRCGATVDGATNGDRFTAYVRQVLAPTLKPGQIVILDNLPSHRVTAAREAIESAGAGLWFLPPCLPGLNLIEPAFSNTCRLCESAALRAARSTRCPGYLADVQTDPPQRRGNAIRASTEHPDFAGKSIIMTSFAHEERDAMFIDRDDPSVNVALGDGSVSLAADPTFLDESFNVVNPAGNAPVLKGWWQPGWWAPGARRFASYDNNYGR